MNEKAVSYARVSSDDRGNEGSNLKSQLDMCREYAERKGYRIVDELSEDERGASGASMELPMLDRVRDMARSSAFDVLIVREIDRLSRDLAKQIIVERELQNEDVRVEYVLGEYPDTPEGNLNKHIKAVIAEYEREKIRERLMRGKRNRVKAGSVMSHGRAPYGYREVKDGMLRFFEVVEEQAKIVKLIFEWYIRGDGLSGTLTIREISKKLTDLGVRNTPGARVWSKSSTAKILSSETYIGVWYYGKYGSQNGKRVYNPREHWIEVEIPAIIDRKTFDFAQEKRKANKINSRRNRKNNYLVGGRIFCGLCGHKMSANPNGSAYKRDGKTYNYGYYRCNVTYAYSHYEVKCDHRIYYRTDHTDMVVWEWVKMLLNDPENLLIGLENYQSQVASDLTPQYNRLEVIRNLLDENNSLLDRLLDLYMDQSIDKEMFVDRKVRLEKTIRSLELEQASILDFIERRELSEDQVMSFKDFAHKISKGLDIQVTGFDDKRRLIELLDLSVTLRTDGEEKIAEVSCILGEDLLSIMSLRSRP